MKKKESIKEKVISFILKGIKKGGALPWDSGCLNKALLAINRMSGKKYRGINRFLLANAIDRNPDAVGEFLTFRQCQKLGGTVQEGQHGCPVVFFSFWDKERKCLKDEKSKEEDIVPLLRMSYVFDLSQIDGNISPKRELLEMEHPALSDVDEFIDKFAKETQLRIELSKKAGCGFYSPMEHRVSVSGLKFYKTREAYYSTVFHEIVHSTARELGRPTSAIFGSERYSQEEIVAECGAMMLCMEFGVKKTPREDSMSYIAHWSKNLKENPNWLFKGASDAEKAVEYILGKMGRTPQVI